jgi:DNA-3-methyladenine glycosylase II
MINIKQPYNFSLSVSVIDSFASESQVDELFLKIPIRINGIPTILEIRQDEADSQELIAFCNPAVDFQSMMKTTEWILFADIDLSPFYQLVQNDLHFSPIVKQLWGIKPMRPASLFEMAVIAITEQQISLAAAYHIRQRMVKRFGDQVNNMWVFPSPAVLASASIDNLRACGLTYRKSEYINDLAKRIIEDSFDFEKLVRLSDDDAREILLRIRGFGRWSADYVLVRGLARPDCIPMDDVAIQNVAGKILGEGRRLNRIELQRIMEPYTPFRGIAAYYLLAYEKLANYNPQMLA